MKNRLILITTIFAVLVCSNLAAAATTVPLNTGYDHLLGLAYPAMATNPSTVQDDYWITLEVDPALNHTSWVVAQTPWGGGMLYPNTRWINSRNTNVSWPNVSALFPGYAIFRKCFCLQPGFQSPRMDFRIRGDNTVSAWLNNTTIPNILVIPTSYPSQATVTNRTTGFRVGPNCVYVLVEDYGGSTGFDLDGTMQAIGLLQTPSKGPSHIPSFGQCRCPTGGLPTDDTFNPSSSVLRQAAADEQKVVNEIRKIAEERRKQKMSSPEKIN